MDKLFKRVPFLKEKRNQKYVLIALILGWIGVLLWFGVIQGVMGAMSARKSTVEAQAKLAELDAQLALITQAKKSLDDVAAYESTANEAIPTSGKVVTLFNTISLIARNNGINITRLDNTSLASKDETADAALNKVGFTFSAEGDYKSLVTFVKTVESLPRIISINTISITNQSDPRDPAPAGNGQLGLNMSGEAYSYE